MWRGLALLLVCAMCQMSAHAEQLIDDQEENDLLIGWKVGVGVGGAGQEEYGYLSSEVWDYDTGTWKQTLNEEYTEVLARVGGVLDFVHFHNPHGLAEWYTWRCEYNNTTRMRYEGRMLNPHTADLDGLVALFGGITPAFYVGSPRCSNICPEMDPDPHFCLYPQVYLGEMMAHDPLYIAFDAVSSQTVEGGPWIGVKDYLYAADVPFLVEANVPKARDDMADVDLFATYQGWLKWRSKTWPRPIEDFDWAHLDFTQAPEEFLPQDSEEAMLWKWKACFTIRQIPNLKSVTIPWEDFLRAGFPIEELAAYLTGDFDHAGIEGN